MEVPPRPELSDEHKEVRARCDAATPGPWVFGGAKLPTPAGHEDILAFASKEKNETVQHGVVTIGLLWDSPGAEKDAAFLSHARVDLPAALDEIERLHDVIYAVLNTCFACMKGVATPRKKG